MAASKSVELAIAKADGAIEAQQTGDNLADDAPQARRPPHDVETQQGHHQHTDNETRDCQDEKDPHCPPAGGRITQRPELTPIGDQDDQHRQRHRDRHELELERVQDNTGSQQHQRHPPSPALAPSQRMRQQKEQYAGHDRRRRGCGNGTRHHIDQGVQPVPRSTSHTGGDVGKADQIGERAHDRRRA